MRAMGLAITPVEAKSLMNEFSIGNEIKFDEICEMIKASEEYITKTQPIRRAFNMIDKNCDGYVTSTELNYLLTLLGECVNEEQTDKLIRSTSLLGYDKVNLQDLIVYLLK